RCRRAIDRDVGKLNFIGESMDYKERTDGERYDGLLHNFPSEHCFEPKDSVFTPRGNAPATPTCPASGSSPVVGLVELVILFALTNQVADGVCSGLKQMPSRAHQLAGQYAAVRQRLDGDNSLASFRQFQPRARMNVKLARNGRRDAD